LHAKTIRTREEFFILLNLKAFITKTSPWTLFRIVHLAYGQQKIKFLVSLTFPEGKKLKLMSSLRLEQ
jgi:hypothetical protein